MLCFSSPSQAERYPKTVDLICANFTKKLPSLMSLTVSLGDSRAERQLSEAQCTCLNLTVPNSHGIKGFVIPTKSFVKTGITKIFCYNNKMFSSINKTFGCCSKIFGWSNKKIICCPQYCCRNKTIFFPCTWFSNVVMS